MKGIKCRDCRYYKPTDPPTMSLVSMSDLNKRMEFGLCSDAERRATEKVPYAIVDIQSTMIAADFVHDCPVYEEYTNG